jgi:dihydroorotase
LAKFTAMRILIKNVRIIGPNGAGKPQDLLVVDGRIEEIGSTITAQVDHEVVGEDLHVSVGWMDLGVQAWDPGYEHREDLDSAREAAAAGGYTHIVLWPDTEPCVDSKAGIRYIEEQAMDHAVRLLAMGTLSKDCAGKDLTEMIDMQEAGAVAFSDGMKSVRNNGVFLRALQYATAFEGLIVHFPYDLSIGSQGHMHEGIMSTSLGLPGIPSISEELMVARDLHLLEYTDSRLHLANISAAGSVQRIREAKAAGLRVTASVPVWNLVYNDNVLSSFDSQFKLMPPLRDESDREALLAGLLDGTIDHISTNHWPWEEEHKSLEFPYAEFGASSLETCYALLQMHLGDQLGIAELTAILVQGARKVLGREIPSIEVGAEADLTVFSPGESWVYSRAAVRSKSYNSPVLEQELMGKVKAVIRSNKYRIFN